MQNNTDYGPQELRNKQVINFLVEDRYRLLRHSVMLLGVLLLLYTSDFSDSFAGKYQYYSLFCTYIIFIGMLYINMYVLVPLFFFRARYVLYLVFLVILVYAGLFFITYIVHTYLDAYRIIARSRGYPWVRGIYEGIIISIPIILVSTTVKLLQRWTKDNERITELKDLTLNMELNELRNQINPHFLFNMLNNVKALIRREPEKAAAVIIKLSDFLRYQLYENNEEKTPLLSEIHFLSNFVNLEKIRRDNLSVSIDCRTDEQDLRNVFVPPNLFTTFVENALKHSVDITGKEAYIGICIGMENKRLRFTCSNSKSPGVPVSDDKYGGLGLANIKRRLELLYRDKYSLDIISADHEFTVNLSIPV